ncbi:MAG TPA: pyridoxal-phosphate dependent enzyme [Sphingomonadaceae bacterium]|nr:pyridoxal-phosphate dependent enzyme [Sphingomonadaceae bacterium]
MIVLPPPKVTEHDGIHVVRDDLIGGGTKARYMIALFDHADEVVYATPAEGGAQTALAWAARELGKRATLFVAKRKAPHARAFMAKRLGAKVYQVTPGYLAVVQARAKAYCAATGATLAPFGVDMPEAIDAIASAALATGLVPDEVWCAAGSGVLSRGLAKAWPKARRFAVQVGRKLAPAEVAGATIIVHPRKYSEVARSVPPFPADPHYDAKAWETAKARRGAGLVVFWNVTGPARP